MRERWRWKERKSEKERKRKRERVTFSRSDWSQDEDEDEDENERKRERREGERGLKGKLRGHGTHASSELGLLCLFLFPRASSGSLLWTFTRILCAYLRSMPSERF